MIIANKFNGYVNGIRTCHTGMEPVLLGAAVGGMSSASRGENPLKGAVLGGVTGGIGGHLLGATPSFLGPAASAAPITALTTPAATGLGEVAATGLGEAAASGAQSFALPLPDISAPMALPPIADVGVGDWLGQYADLATGAGEAAASPISMGEAAAPNAPGSASRLSLLGNQGANFNYPNRFAAATPNAPSKGLMEMWQALPIEKKLLYGGGGLGLMSLLSQPKNRVPTQAAYDGPLSKFKYDPLKYRAAFARGGIASLGSYSDGGRLLKGPGDGMSDHIPATIAKKQPARLADGEFVVPADVVSHLGNGSTDAGAKQLYAMMNRVRKQRTGRQAQGKRINPQKFVPA